MDNRGKGSSREQRYIKLSRRARNGEDDSYSMQSLPSTKRRPRGKRKYKLQSADHRSVSTEPSLLPSRIARNNRQLYADKGTTYGQRSEENLQHSTVHRPENQSDVAPISATARHDRHVIEQANKIAQLSLENEELRKRLERMEQMMQRTLAGQMNQPTQMQTQQNAEINSTPRQPADLPAAHTATGSASQINSGNSQTIQKN